MVTSYEAGAKYIAIFNYPYEVETPFAVLSQAHFDAIHKFWEEVRSGQLQRQDSTKAALVLPMNFGWGMRNPTDTIWGLWLTDNRTTQVALATYNLLERYGTTLDIIYEDPAYPVANASYPKVYWWNQNGA